MQAIRAVQKVLMEIIQILLPFIVDPLHRFQQSDQLYSQSAHGDAAASFARAAE